MKKTVLALSILSMSLMACSKSNTETTTETTASSETIITQSVDASAPVSSEPVSGGSAETSLDWNGEYKGSLPCADCDAIKTKLELNKDKTFELSRKYVGIKNTEQKSKVEGSFTFDAKNPSIILLGAPENKKVFIGENYVQFLDEDGNKITGPMADLYILKKD